MRTNFVFSMVSCYEVTPAKLPVFSNAIGNVALEAKIRSRNGGSGVDSRLG